MTSVDHLLSQPPQLGPDDQSRSQRARYGPHELAIVLSHYDLGRVRRIRECPLGSRQSPKVRITTASHDFLLKRRAPGRDDRHRVAFSHHLQIQLHQSRYPVPALIGTRDDTHSMLELDNRIYELFEFVPGVRYDQSVAQTTMAGRALGELHRLAAAHPPGSRPPTGTYHGAAEADPKFAQLVPAVSAAEPQMGRKRIARLANYLRQAYHDAARRVDELGYHRWSPMILHGDWHPGNLLFRDGLVVGVLDFDSARQEARMADVANGVLQFSIRMSDPARPLTWPEGLDAQRIKAFIGGYHAGARQLLEGSELQALPWLIVEALIVESLVPIAATGSFGRIPGSHFLAMVEQKVRWLRPRTRKLVEFLDHAEA